MKHVTRKTNLSLTYLEKRWKETIPDCGLTNLKHIKDDYYSLTWVVKHNYKRMLRRSAPIQKDDSCPFCRATQSKDNALASIDNFIIYGNKYPIEPLHLLLFNAVHTVDPSLTDLLTIGQLLKLVPSIKVLISHRLGSGASVPAHLHVHAFRMHLPLEDAQDSSIIFTTKDFKISILHYPAWTVGITYTPNIYYKLAKVLIKMIDTFRIPFNITITSSRIFLIPRYSEDPQICQNIVDGVGSLETAGIYTTVSKEALNKTNIQTFHEGLKDASFAKDTHFQSKFLKILIDTMKSL